MTPIQHTDSKPVSARHRQIEILIGVLVSFLAIAAIVVSRKFPSTGLATDIGSARFPLIYSCALIVLSGVLIARNLLKKTGETTVEPVSDEEDAPAPQHKKTILGIVSTVASLILMPFLGYPLVTASFLAFLMWLLGMRSKVLNPLLAVVITGLLYFTFSTALNVPLPVGSLFE